MNSESKTHRRLQHGFLGYPRLICTGYMRTPCAESGLVFREAVVWGLRYALCLRPFQHLVEFALAGPLLFRFQQLKSFRFACQPVKGDGLPAVAVLVCSADNII